MTTTIDRLIQDPVIAAASLLILAAFAFLVWIINRLMQDGHESIHAAPLLGSSITRKPSPTAMTSAEVSGIAEAHLTEITAQVADISKRLAAIEKTLQSLPAGQVETLMNRIAPLLKTHQSSSQQVDLSQIEAKLNGIHKLLILLTDSGAAADDES